MFTYWPLYCLSHSLSVFFPSGDWDGIVLIEELKDMVQKISVSKMLDLHLVIPIPLTICCISRITALNISLPSDNSSVFYWKWFQCLKMLGLVAKVWLAIHGNGLDCSLTLVCCIFFSALFWQIICSKHKRPIGLIIRSEHYKFIGCLIHL